MGKGRLLLLVLVGVVVAGAASVGAVLVLKAHAARVLRWKFEPGQELGRVLTHEVATTLTDGKGNQIKTSSVQTTDMDCVVMDVDPDGVAELDQRIRRIQFKQDTPHGSMDLDTKGKPQLEGPSHLVDSVFRMLVDKRMLVKMRPNGQVAQVAPPEGLLQTISAMGGGAEAAARLVSTDGLHKLMQEGVPWFPDQPIKPGQHWSQEIKMEMQPIGTLKVRSKYSYVGEEEIDGRPLERVDVTTQITVASAAKPEGAPSITLKNPQAGGHIYFDSHSGRLATSDLSQAFTVELRQGDQVMTQQFDQRTKLVVRGPE